MGFGGRSNPAPQERPPGSHLFAPDNLRRPTPSFPPRAVSQATYARRDTLAAEVHTECTWPFPGIHADVRLGPEIPLLAFARLVHLRIALSDGVLGRRRSVNDGRIHNRPRADANAFAPQVQVHRVQDFAAQLVLFKQMAEAQHGRFVRRWLTFQTHLTKPQRRRFIERVFLSRVRQVEPLLKKVNPQHDRQTYRLAAIARLGIMRLDQRFQFTPRNDSFHALQKLFPFALPPVLLETSLGRQCDLSHRAPYPLTTLFNLAVDLGLVQSFPGDWPAHF